MFELYLGHMNNLHTLGSKKKTRTLSVYNARPNLSSSFKSFYLSIFEKWGDVTCWDGGMSHAGMGDEHAGMRVVLLVE